jgi:hypothetical protein
VPGDGLVGVVDTEKAVASHRTPKVLFGGKNFIAPGEVGGFFEGGGDGAVFFLGEGDGVLYGGVIEIAAQAEQDFEVDPDGGRFGGAFAGAGDFEGLHLLAFFLKDDDDVGGGAGGQSHEDQLHRAGGCVGFAVGIDEHGVAGGTGGGELLVADPFDGGGLHGSLLSYYRIRDKSEEGVDAAEKSFPQGLKPKSCSSLMSELKLRPPVP